MKSIWIRREKTGVPSIRTDFILAVTAALLLSAVPGCGKTERLPIIPAPLESSVSSGSFNVSSETEIISSSSSGLTALLYKGIRSKNIPGAVSSGPVSLNLDPSVSGDEEYFLSVSSSEVVIRARTDRGLFYGMQSLLQCISDDGSVRQCSIHDRPRFPYRGFLLDTSRHYFPVSFIKAYIDLMASYKFNAFHWHLTDDQGWRLEIKKYPRLTSVGSIRKGSQVDRSGTVVPGECKGFYSQNDIRDIVSFAAERHVDVIPEIDMPGHSTALISAYPECSCEGRAVPVRTSWGVSEDILCAGNPQTYEMVCGILDEVFALFPSRYIHIGGDEVPFAKWRACPKCRKRIEVSHLRDMTGLRRFFTESVREYVSARGKTVIGWNENADAGVSKNMIIMSWRDNKKGKALLEAGYNIIQTPGRYCYLDRYQSDPVQEPAANGGYLPLRKVYTYDPSPPELDSAGGAVLGVQYNLWTEYIPDEKTAEFRAFPRALAGAEAAWSSPSRKSWNSFVKRLPPHLKKLEDRGVSYCRTFDESDFWTDLYIRFFRKDYL